MSVDAFKSWVNLTNVQCIKEYVGPKLVVYNSSASCYEPLEEFPREHFAHLKCDKYGDMAKLYRWRYGSCIPLNEKVFPIVQVKNHNSTEKIYCYGTNITYLHRNMTVPCPPNAVELYDLGSFSIDIDSVRMVNMGDGGGLALILFIVTIIAVSTSICIGISCCIGSRFHRKLHIYQMSPPVDVEAQTESRFLRPSSFKDESLDTISSRMIHYPLYV